METLTLFEKKIAKVHSDNPSSTIARIEAGNIIYVYAKGFSNGEKYRNGCMIMLEAIRKHRSKKILNNLVNMQVIPAEEQQWTANVFMPALLKEGPIYSASVLPESMFAQISLSKVNAVTTAANSPITRQSFATEEEAYQWLVSVK